MNIPLTRRLSYKQASLTVLAAFILGTVLSLLQVSIDYANEDASINREIHALLEKLLRLTRKTDDDIRGQLHIRHGGVELFHDLQIPFPRVLAVHLLQNRV